MTSSRAAIAGGIVTVIGLVIAFSLARRKNVLTSNTACIVWNRPLYKDIPADVLARAWAIKDDVSIPLWTHLVETLDGQSWRFNVVIHGTNEIVNHPHRGVDVEVCSAS
jgi:hypothetical protein